MTAFGPYKNTEVIDFRQLGAHKLFVVAGDTGAGKTTIFDGISYALYGSASGMDRENNLMLRSHFTEDDVHTVVELEFELSGRKYRVLRQPGHVKKGNKSKTGERYEFYELVNGAEVIAVERQIVSDIDAKIEEIIGLTRDQFKQIVMLPQGEFQKLLTSDTKNKEDILRRLFKTERYDHLAKKLKEKRDNLKQEYVSEAKMVDHYIQHISSKLVHRESASLFSVIAQENFNMQQIYAGLDEEIVFYKSEQVENEVNYENALQKHTNKQNYIERAKLVNERFELLKVKAVEMEQLEKRKVEFLRYERRIDYAIRTSKLEPYERQVVEQRSDLSNRLEMIVRGKKVLETATSKLAETKVNYEREQSRQVDRDKVKRDLDRFYEQLPVVKDIDQRRVQLEKSARLLDKESKELEQSKQDINDKSKEMESIQAEIELIEKQTSNLAEVKYRTQELRIQYKLFDDYRKLSIEHSTLSEEVNKRKIAFNRVKNRYVTNESIWLHNQATVLANRLHDGDDCPVCGSRSHPNKAKSNQDMITKEELDELRTEMNDYQEKYNTILTQSLSIADQLRKHAMEIGKHNVALELVVPTIEKIQTQGIKLSEEVKAIEQAIERNKKLKLKNTELGDFVKHTSEKRERNLLLHQTEMTSFTSLEATFKEQLRNIDTDMQDLTKLEAEISHLEKLKTKMEERWIAVQHQLRADQETFTTAEVNYVNAEVQYKEIDIRLAGMEEYFKNELIKARFESEQEYEQAKLTEESRVALEEKVTAYKENVLKLNNQVDELNKELMDEQFIHISEMEQHLIELKKAYEYEYDKLNAAKKSIEAAKAIKENLLISGKKKQAAEEELAIVTDLYNTIRGDNPKKISFERYLQIDYLDQIMVAANERFRQLSDGQFYLRRSERLESHGRPSGLAIDVHDSLTGQARDVKTLSGGEKFIASLCLALGMSDVIQSFQGNISIETMFIDEGFGTLDEEFLNKAIDVLIELQNTGRTIGVISHREELKAVFPAMLAVEKTKEGYSKTKFIFK